VNSSGPAYGAGGRKFWLVHVHTVPVVLSSNGTMSSDAQRGQP